MGPTIEQLDDLAAGWSDSLLTASWQGGLAIAAAWVLVRFRPGLPPRVACWIWRLVDLKLIVALVWAAPLLLPLLPPPAEPDPPPEASAPATGLPANLAGGSGRFAPSTGDMVEPPAMPCPSVASVALVLWLSGVIGAVALAGRGLLAAIRLRHSCSPIDRPDLSDAASGLARVLGQRHVPELKAGPAVARPMLVGAWCPAILLPMAMVRDPRSIGALGPILAHELAHVRRRDLLWSGLTGLVRSLFYFHPLVGLAHREALVAREAACDALALAASGVRPSEYGRILLEIAAEGPERPARLAAALGMAGPAASLGRRLIAMKTTHHQPSRRRLASWAAALLAIGAAGILPWRLVHREARAQETPAKPAASDAPERRAAANRKQARFAIIEADLQVAQAQYKVAEAVLAQAEAEAASSIAQRKYREKQKARIAELDRRGAIEHRLVEEEDDRLREAQAAERAAEAKSAVARATLDDARAAVREAEAERDIARAESRGADAEGDLKAARVRLHEATLDRARAEHRAARAEGERAEAALKKAGATVEYRTRQLERIKDLAGRGSVERRLADEEEDRLNAARVARRQAEAAVDLARARLKVAEARVRSIEAKARVGAQPSLAPPRRR